MKRRGWLIVGALGVGVVAGIALSAFRLEAGGSTYSHGASGWLAARLYLQRRGDDPVTIDRPLATAPSGSGTLVVTFPWQGHAVQVDREDFLAHLAHSGDLVIAYSGDPVPSPAEDQLLAAVGIGNHLLPRAPLSPWRWRRVMAEVWRLRPAVVGTTKPAADSFAALQLRRPHWLPDLPRQGALLVGPGDQVVAAAWSLRRGRVVVLPAELLSNARLSEAGHGALLETLRRWLAAPWRFDEYHHGLGPAESAEAVPATVRRGFDLLLLQLLLIYGFAALALGRRLGPAWREAPTLVGNAGTFLLRLGALHHRLGHHGEGAALLLRRAGELDRRLQVDASLMALAVRGDAAALVEVGQAVARLQRR